MAAWKELKETTDVTAKAQRVLEFAQQQAATSANWIELSNALFGSDGKATELFATEKERSEFCRTKEYKRILALLDTMPQPPVSGFVDATLLWNSQTRPACPPSSSKM